MQSAELRVEFSLLHYQLNCKWNVGKTLLKPSVQMAPCVLKHTKLRAQLIRHRDSFDLALRRNLAEKPRPPPKQPLKPFAVSWPYKGHLSRSSLVLSAIATIPLNRCRSRADSITTFGENGGLANRKRQRVKSACGITDSTTSPMYVSCGFDQS